MERSVFMREQDNHMYRIHTYYGAKVVSDLPFQIVLAMSFAGIVYWMVGLNTTDPTRFIIFYLMCVPSPPGVCWCRVRGRQPHSSFGASPGRDRRTACFWCRSTRRRWASSWGAACRSPRPPSPWVRGRRPRASGPTAPRAAAHAVSCATGGALSAVQGRASWWR